VKTYQIANYAKVIELLVQDGPQDLKVRVHHTLVAKQFLRFSFQNANKETESFRSFIKNNSAVWSCVTRTERS
jgi:uncharacterized protein YccT (UPF0319 family)